jgi:hypothetical protein
MSDHVKLVIAGLALIAVSVSIVLICVISVVF